MRLGRARLSLRLVAALAETSLSVCRSGDKRVYMSSTPVRLRRIKDTMA